MRYSQPFGTPAPPLGQYPRYINGDPITGTEGSIPPATAFDETQIEIISVIEGVRALGLGNLGPPSHADLTQLWQAIQAFFLKQYITTHITKTVHGAGADFPDLVAAMDWLSHYIITPSGFVTFMCSPGKWTYTTAVELGHANISRVAIQGAAMNAVPRGSSMSVTGYNNPTDGINQAIFLRSCYQTELFFQGGISGFVVLRGGCTLRYLLITGDLSAPPGNPPWGLSGAGSGLECYDELHIECVSCWGLFCGWWLTGAGSITSGSALNNGVSYCTYGILGFSAYIYMAHCETFCTSCMSGMFFAGGYYYFGCGNVRGMNSGNGTGAVNLQGGSIVQFASSPWAPSGYSTVISTNNCAGVLQSGATTFAGEGATYSGNANYGISVAGTGTAWCDDSTFYSNGSYSAVASGNAYVEVLRCALYDPTAASYGGIIAQ